MKIKLSDHSLERLDLDQLSLSKDVIYFVLGIDDESFRIINDLLEPVLYEKDIFEIVDSSIPDHWIKREYEDGEYHIDPPEFARPGFFEDYFDGIQSAVKKYNRYLKLNGLEKCVK